ncbi:hypothetical protein [Thalassotalea ganghwensis]
MRDKHKQMLVKISAEALSIVVAVLFALWANDWWAQRERTQQVEVLFSAVLTELEENKLSLENSYQHHTKQLDIIKQSTKSQEKLTEQNYKDIYQQLFKHGVFRPAQLYFTYWEIMRDKGLLAELSNQQLSKVKPAYYAMRLYQNTWQTISNNMLNVALLDSEQKKIVMISNSLRELWWRENFAIQSINTTLENLSDIKKTN